jgi:hypothetical protein
MNADQHAPQEIEKGFNGYLHWLDIYAYTNYLVTAMT